MSEQSHYKFKIDSAKEILLSVPDEVFIPTGTTKCLIKAVQSYIRNPGKVLDLGCGCGIVGIALNQIGLVKPPLYASDLSEQAVACLKDNAALYQCPTIAKCGSLFDPWKGEKFDYIINDVSGVAEEAAKISPWFNNIPCLSGADGTSLIIEVLKMAPSYLNKDGLFFFPVISFSNVNKILTAAHENFSYVERLIHKEWPLPEGMLQHISTLKKLQEKCYVQIMEKYGMIIWFTDIYVASNSSKNSRIKQEIKP